MSAPPDGFAPHERGSPLTEPWEPIYASCAGDGIVLGVRLRAEHTNSRAFAHGGFVAALADNAMGLSCSGLFTPRVRLVTVNLSVSYEGVAKIGQWVTFEPRHLRTGRTLCFADLFVRADGEICARASATFATVA